MPLPRSEDRTAENARPSASALLRTIERVQDRASCPESISTARKTARAGNHAAASRVGITADGTLDRRRTAAAAHREVNRWREGRRRRAESGVARGPAERLTDERESLADHQDPIKVAAL